MILQYFKIKENEYKIKSNEIYLNILNKSKFLLNKKYFNEINFGTYFELISVFLIFYLHFLKDKKIDLNKKINEELLKHLVNDLDKSLRDLSKSLTKFFINSSLTLLFEDISSFLKNFR